MSKRAKLRRKMRSKAKELMKDMLDIHPNMKRHKRRALAWEMVRNDFKEGNL